MLLAPAKRFRLRVQRDGMVLGSGAAGQVKRHETFCNRPLEWLLYPETLLTAYGDNSAFAVVGLVARLGLPCDGYRPFSRRIP